MCQAGVPEVCQEAPGAGVSPPWAAQCCRPAGGSAAWFVTAHSSCPESPAPPGSYS